MSLIRILHLIFLAIEIESVYSVHTNGRGIFYPGVNYSRDSTVLAKRGGPSRDVFVILSQISSERITVEDGKQVNPSHIAIQLSSSEADDVVRLDLIRPSKDAPHIDLSVMRITDPTFIKLEDGAKTSGRGSVDTVHRIGATTATNEAFASWAHYLHSSLKFNADERIPITSAYSTILDLLKSTIINVPGTWRLPVNVVKALESSQWWEMKKIEQKVMNPTPFEGNSRFRTLTLHPARGTVIESMIGSDLRTIFSKPVMFFHSGLSFPLLGFRRVPVKLRDGRQGTMRLRLSVFSSPEWNARFPVIAQCYVGFEAAKPAGGAKRSLDRRESCGNIDESKVVKSTELPKGAPTERVTVRVNGALRILESFGKVGDGLGVAGLAAGPAFVLLDIAQGDKIGAAINAGGIALELGVLVATRSLALAGAVGLVTAPLLFVLPLFFEKSYPPGRSSNTSEILRFKFFGDRTSEGNENCVKERKSQNLGTDCTMLFGPGKIAEVFKWDNFDAVIFLIAFNDGYAMSIQDIADSFRVMETKPIPDNTTNSIATIQCDGVYKMIRQPPPLPDKRGDPLRVSDAYECKNARFSIKRELIMLPYINKTAADIVPRMVGKNGGDCKLVVDPLDGKVLPGYDFVWKGLPSAISCNITTATLAQIGQSNGSTPIIKIPDPSVPAIAESGTVEPGRVDKCLIQLLNAGGLQLSQNGTLFSTYFRKGLNDSIDNAPMAPNASASLPDASEADQDKFNLFDYIQENTPNAMPWYSSNSTLSNLTCANQTLLELLKQWKTANQLPPAFFTGNSSITNNATLYSSPGNASSDSETGRAYVAAPPTTPFTLTNTSNSICFVYTDHNLCLPNGTYAGIFTNPRWELKKIQSITGPPGSWVTFKSLGEAHPPNSAGKVRETVSTTYKPNMTSKDSGFSNVVSSCNRVVDDTTHGKLEIYIPDQLQIPAMCLYSEKGYTGGVQCLGVGAGDIPKDFQNKTSSLTTYRNASAYIYANRYGDASQTLIKGDIESFSGLLYGINETLNDALVAMWIFDPLQQRIG